MQAIGQVESPMGLLAVLALVCYMLVKDVVIPLVRRRNGNRNGNGNPGKRYATPCPCAEIIALTAKVDAQHEEYLRAHERMDRNIGTIFNRMEEIQRFAAKVRPGREEESGH